MLVWLICSEAQNVGLGLLPPNFHITHGLEAPPLFDAVLDLLFEENRSFHQPYLSGLSVPVIVAALMVAGKDLPPSFVRVNAWPGFFQGRRVEACGTHQTAKASATAVLKLLAKEPEWVSDEPGMISARVIAGIINEAYLAWSEGIASKEDIDTAMKLGTNYPHGPFEWGEKIGLERVVQLLEVLGATHDRYRPCSALKSSIHG